jgi:hypothetical protein
METKRVLQLIAGIVLLGAIAFWFAKGANRGWTKNRVEIRTVEEITGMDTIHYEDRYIPGVEFLGGAVVLSGALFALSFCCRKTETSKPAVSS